MPRSLARLRWREPLKPVSIPRRLPKKADEPLLSGQIKAVETYVQRQSNPRLLKLHTVVNPKARRQPTAQSVVAPIKPYTLRDIADPEGRAQHGEIVYVFRNTDTNQIIYSLQELLDKHHLEQLPFISRHSKPPTLRPDEWAPHCVITFPTAAQGHNAYRKLREFRHLHELAWEKTNPEYKVMDVKQRMKKIMDQRANMSADLAAVLTIQEQHGVKAAEEQKEQKQKADEWMDTRWKSIDAMANAAAAKEKVGDNIKWLEHQQRRLNLRLKQKHHQNEADQKSINAALAGITNRLNKLHYAVRKAEQFKDRQAILATAAEPVTEEGVQENERRLQEQKRIQMDILENPDSTLTPAEAKSRKSELATLKAEIAKFKTALEAKAQVEQRDHYIAKSVLPRALRKSFPTPYTLEGVKVRWAELQDAMFARGQWPEVIEHEALDINASRRGLALLSAEEFEIEKNYEVGKIIEELQRSRIDSGEPLFPATA